MIPTPALPKGGRWERGWDIVRQTTPNPSFGKGGERVSSLEKEGKELARWKRRGIG